MKKIFLVTVTFIVASCISVARLPSRTIEANNKERNAEVKSKDDCSNYALTKTEHMTDSVRLQVNVKSCKFNETIYGALLIRDKNNVVSKFQTDANGQAIIVLKEGEYSIQFIFIHFKSLQIPLRSYKNGNYLVSMNAAFDDPIIN